MDFYKLYRIPIFEIYYILSTNFNTSFLVLKIQVFYRIWIFVQVKQIYWTVKQ